MTTLTRSNKALIFDFCWVVATLAVFLFVAEWRRANPGPSLLISHDMSETLGAEYNAIAIAIVKGRGFSDPFMVESGPTAWMPPILPYIIAVLYYLFSGDKSYVIFFLHTFQSISIYFAGFVFIRISRLFRPFGLGHVILPIGLLTEFQGLFQRLDDTWLILFVYNLVLLNAVGMARGRKQSYLWIRSGCLIGFTTLCSPIAGVVGFISFSIGLLIRYSVVMKGKRRNIRWILGHLIRVSVLATCILFPWNLRNLLMLDAWIPIKSNFAYELWQSQNVDDDGVLDLRTILEHPWSFANDQRQLYIELGEVEFCKIRWLQARTAITRDPFSFVKRVCNRFSAACILPVEFSVNLDSFYNRRFRTFLYSLPFLACFFLTVLCRNKCNITIIAAAIYVIGLAPFILFSYLERYGVPLVSVKMILVCVAASKVLAPHFSASRLSNATETK